MRHKVVCISSHDGAGAQETAVLVASSLGYRVIDEDIVTRAAVEAGVEEGVVADVERRKSLVLRLIEGMGTAGMGMSYAVPALDTIGPAQPASDELRGLIRSVIEDTATAGSAVILARGVSRAISARGCPQSAHDSIAADTRAPARERARGRREGGRASHQAIRCRPR